MSPSDQPAPLALDLVAQNTRSLHLAARAYAQGGIPVFPCAVGGKTPLVRWSEVATTDPAVIDRWWAETPDANIGLVMGGGWLAIDLDEKDGRSGGLSYELADGPVDRRWPAQVTPSGGLHYLVRTDLEGLRNVTRRGVGGGLDLRTMGGYILGAPSRVLVNGVLVPYRWGAGGDPRAPLPETFAATLVAWSQAAAQAAGALVPVPDPEVLTDPEVQALIDSLGDPYTTFLRTGATWTGDTSRDAHTTCRVAFSRGWTLARLARVGPDTVLAYFGSNPPHHAVNPWAWAWRYTVNPAWHQVQAQRQAIREVFPVLETKKDPLWGAERAGTNTTRTEGPDSVERDQTEVQPDPNITACEAPVNPASADDLYALALERARALPEFDVPALEHWLDGVLGMALPEHRVEALLLLAKQVARVPLSLLRTMRKEIAALQQQTRAEHRAAQAAGSPYLFVTEQAKLLDRRHNGWVSLPGLAAAQARHHGGTTTRALEALLHREDATIGVVDAVTYHPGEPHGQIYRGTRVLWNTYQPSPLVPVPGDIGPWRRLLARLCLEGGQAVEERLIDELAWMLQHPGQRLNHGLLLGGCEGAGKDSLLAPFMAAVGRHNVTQIAGEALASDFNAWLLNTKLLVVQEVRFADHKERGKVHEVLKGYLAAPPDELSVNQKNISPVSIPNLLNVVMTTNWRDALRLTPDSRRYFCVWSDAQAPTTRVEVTAAAEFFDAYWTWLDQGGAAAVAAFLLARPTDHIRPGERPMTTEWFDELSASGGDELEGWLRYRRLLPEGFCDGRPFTEEDVLNEIQKDPLAAGLRNRVIGLRWVQRALASTGARRVKLMVLPDGSVDEEGDIPQSFARQYPGETKWRYPTNRAMWLDENDELVVPEPAEVYDLTPRLVPGVGGAG